MWHSPLILTLLRQARGSFCIQNQSGLESLSQTCLCLSKSGICIFCLCNYYKWGNTHIQRSGRFGVLFCHLLPYFPETGPSPRCGARLAEPSYLLVSTSIQKAHGHFAFLHGCWGFKFMPSCLCSKWSYPLIHLTASKSEVSIRSPEAFILSGLYEIVLWKNLFLFITEK